jgi:membrane-associated phospholipid phosphatase
MSPDQRTGAGRYFQRAREFISARFDTRSHLGLGLTIRLVLFGLAVWAFSGLLDAVLDNATLVRLDRIVAAWFAKQATPRGRDIFAVVTLLGSEVTYVLMGIGVIYLWFAGERAHLVTWIAANGGGKALEYLIKNTVHRSRPEYSADYLHGQSYSFPSGHTMGATICYLLIAYLIAAHPRVSKRVAVLVHVGAIGIIVAVALSRLYLDVHYLTDVLGGAMAGLAWVAMCGATRHVVVGYRDSNASATSHREESVSL